MPIGRQWDRTPHSFTSVRALSGQGLRDRVSARAGERYDFKQPKSNNNHNQPAAPSTGRKLVHKPMVPLRILGNDGSTQAPRPLPQSHPAGGDLFANKCENHEFCPILPRKRTFAGCGVANGNTDANHPRSSLRTRPLPLPLSLPLSPTLSLSLILCCLPFLLDSAILCAQLSQDKSSEIESLLGRLSDTNDEMGHYGSKDSRAHLHARHRDILQDYTQVCKMGKWWLNPGLMALSSILTHRRRCCFGENSVKMRAHLHARHGDILQDYTQVLGAG
jgi:hypothetical protein